MCAFSQQFSDTLAIKLLIISEKL